MERFRRAAGDALALVLPEPEAGLAAGILIGLRDRVDREVAAAFTTAGVSHVVAISGWNIAIVAAAIGAVAGRLGRRRRSIVTALAIVAYVAFAGASPSVLRAGAMAGVVLLARESGRAGLAATALGWAAAILLFVDPRLVGDAGFQLSTLATAGLIAWATPMTARMVRWTGGRLPAWVTESLGVSLAAQAATLPIVLASFGRLAVIAPAVNLAIVPIVAPAMAAGIVALIGGLVVGSGGPAVIGSILAVPAWVALRVIVSVVDASTAVPFASLELPPAAAVAAGLASAMVLLAVATHAARPDGTVVPLAATMPTRSARRPAGSRALRLATMALIASVGMAGVIAVTRPESGSRLTVLDVGQGDAILVEGSRGGRLLVDGGPDPDRLLVALDRRIPPWDRRIDVVVLSHPHEDHVAGLAMLLRRYRVGRVLEPGMRGPGPGYDAWSAILAELGSPARGTVAAGDRLQVDDIDLDVLWPRRGSVPGDPPDDGTGINNVSVVLAGAVAGRRFLLMGDVEEEIDPVLLTQGLAPVDVLKVAHHGSRTATTQAFVDAIRPSVAIASAGARNRYGHPAPATMERLANAGASVLRTDRDGTVVVRFEASGVRVASEGPRGARSAGPAWPPPGHRSPRHRPWRRASCAGSRRRNRRERPTRRPSSRPSSRPDHDTTLPPARRDSSATIGSMLSRLLYLYGDDDLVAARLVERFGVALAAELGTPLERWELTATQNTATTDAALLYERLATPVLFGGGTLAVVHKPGALVRRNETRDRVLAGIRDLADGNALVFVEASQSNAKGPGPAKLAEAVRGAGGRVAAAMGPRPTNLAAWIESEARERGLVLAPGAARALAERLGSRVTEGDVERRHLSRVASGELDKLALRHAIDGGPVTSDDVEALVAEALPASVWALTDAVGARRTEAALDALERVGATTPEPVVLAVLHKRVVDLLEVGDRVAVRRETPGRRQGDEAPPVRHREAGGTVTIVAVG